MTLERHASEAATYFNARAATAQSRLQAVGWGSRASQTLRFDNLFRGQKLKSTSILDVGCGLGDLVGYLKLQASEDFTYVGVDVASVLLDEAKLSLQSETCLFYLGDIFSLDLKTADHVVASGTFSLRIAGAREYARQSMARMFELSRVSTALNFLSTKCDYMLDKNLHYDPSEVLKWALDLCPRVSLHHDYPLYEFTVQLHHDMK